MKITKLTEAEFNKRSEESCTKPGKMPTAKVYKGDVPVMLNFPDYDLPIPADKYKWLVFVPCELVGEHLWISGFDTRDIVKLARYIKPQVVNGAVRTHYITEIGKRVRRAAQPSTYDIIELEANGVLFAFHH